MNRLTTFWLSLLTVAIALFVLASLDAEPKIWVLCVNSFTVGLSIAGLIRDWE